jgi:hypothetical protein
MQWEVAGLSATPLQAFTILSRLPGADGLPSGLRLGTEARYWQAALMLLLETLAQQRLLPLLAQADAAGTTFHARWLPVLDDEEDGARLAHLRAAMPPLCRAGAPAPAEALAPRALLDSFLNTLADALAREWGRAEAPRFPGGGGEPAHRWLTALFSANPAVKGSAAQLQHLHRSHRLWLRNLHVAGDAHMRVAFRLAAPGQTEADDEVREWTLHFLLQARDDPSLLVPAEQVWQTRGSILQALGHRFEQPQEKMLAGLGYAARHFAPLQKALKSATPTRLTLEADQAYHFLRESAPLLQASGFGVLVPPWWNKPGSRLGVRLKLQPARPGETHLPQGHVTFERLVRYRWELSLGETALTEEEFAALAALKSPLVHIRGQRVRLDPEQVESAIRFWEKHRQGESATLQEALQMGLGAEEAVDGLEVKGVEYEGWLADWIAHFKGDEALTLLPPPEGLEATLRPYQQHGYSWLDFLRRWGWGPASPTIWALVKGSRPSPSCFASARRGCSHSPCSSSARPPSWRTGRARCSASGQGCASWFTRGLTACATRRSTRLSLAWTSC